MLTLQAQERVARKNKVLRTEGKIPVVMYGRSQESKSLSVDLIEFKKIWRDAGESTIITLNDGTEEHDALIHDVVVHPVTEQPIHVDFYIVEKGQLITVNVQFDFVGVAPVEDLGFQVVKVLHEIEVEAKAKDLPSSIEVDISSLVAEDSQIAVKDIKLPSGVVTTADQDEVVVTVVTAEEEVEEETPTDLSSIEVEKKGKTEEALEE